MNSSLEDLPRIFSDADVIDLDFSEWDKHVSLWVLADHWEDWRDKKPVLIVRFDSMVFFLAVFQIRKQRQQILTVICNGMSTSSLGPSNMEY